MKLMFLLDHYNVYLLNVELENQQITYLKKHLNGIN
jgi:hypothetical protein